MKITSPLLAFLAKSMPGASRAEPMDSQISVNPELVMVSQIPSPVLRLFNAPAAIDPNVSFFLHDQQSMAATTGQALVKLSEGLWDIEWAHYIEMAGATADPTSSADITLNFPNVTGGPVTLSRLRNVLSDQYHSGEFTLQVAKGFEPTFQRNTTVGTGLGTGFSWFVLRAFRIL